VNESFIQLLSQSIDQSMNLYCRHEHTETYLYAHIKHTLKNEKKRIKHN